jgi:hypothetical protein
VTDTEVERSEIAAIKRRWLVRIHQKDLAFDRSRDGHAKTSTIAVIEQATLPAKQANRHPNRQAADRPQPSAKPPAAQESARSVPRSKARDRSRELDYGR